MLQNSPQCCSKSCLSAAQLSFVFDVLLLLETCELTRWLFCYPPSEVDSSFWFFAAAIWQPPPIYCQDALFHHQMPIRLSSQGDLLRLDCRDQHLYHANLSWPTARWKISGHVYVDFLLSLLKVWLLFFFSFTVPRWQPCPHRLIVDFWFLLHWMAGCCFCLSLWLHYTEGSCTTQVGCFLLRLFFGYCY